MNNAMRRPLPVSVVMPDQMTPGMRRAAMQVKTPITSAEVPYLDQLYAAMLDAARVEQTENHPATQGMRRR